MRYTVLLHRYSAGVYEAVAPAAPGCKGRGANRTEALKQLRMMLQEWADTTEITSIDVECSKKEYNKPNPWLATAGIFEDDPMLEPMLHDIYSSRDAELKE